MALSKKDNLRIEKVFSGACSQKSPCPVKDIMARYGDKWSMYTVLLLGKHDRLRFTQLRTGINGISQRMLTVTLRSLEQDGIVLRTLHPEIPTKVEYELTILGISLLQQLLLLVDWADEHLSEISQARKKYEKIKLQNAV
jgi:DNA-binding HxlR family transcriptional regulator